MYYKNADAIVLIYDVTDRQSYLDIYNYWIPEIESFGETDVIFFIVGNKIDLSSKLVEMNEVNQDLKERLNDKNYMSFETSIITGTNIAEVSNELLKTLVDRKFGKKTENVFFKKRICDNQRRRNQKK